MHTRCIHYCTVFCFINITFQSFVTCQCVTNFLLVDPFWPQNVTTDPHILAHIECPDSMYPKLIIYTSELILDRYLLTLWVKEVLLDILMVTQNKYIAN